MADDLHGLSRRELQALAKVHGVKANQKSGEIIEQLAAKLAPSAPPPPPTPPPQGGGGGEGCGSAMSDRPNESGGLRKQRRTWELPPPAGAKLSLPLIGDDDVLCDGMDDEHPAKQQEQEQQHSPPMVSMFTATRLADEALQAAAVRGRAKTADGTAGGSSSGTGGPPSDFFGAIHQRVAVLLSASPASKHAGLRKSLSSLSNTLLDAVVASRGSATPKQPPPLPHIAVPSAPPLPAPDFTGALAGASSFATSPSPAGARTPSRVASSPAPASFGSGASLLSSGARRVKHKPPVPRLSAAALMTKPVGPPVPRVAGAGRVPAGVAGKKHQEARRRAHAEANKAKRRQAVNAARWRP